MEPQTTHKRLIVLAGPTAVGKTATAIELARNFQTEIISCDSRQVYKELDIGVARPSKSELQAVQHHFIANKSIHQSYTAGKYAREVNALLFTLFEKYNEVVMTGGTGLYIKAAIEGLDYPANKVPEVRDRLTSIYEAEGLSGLQIEANKYDITEKELLLNPQRLMRAIEVAKTKAKGESKNWMVMPEYNAHYFYLNRDRQELYDRINLRVDQMMKDGFLNEAKEVYPYRQLNALQTVGYKELFTYLDGEWTLDYAIDKIKQKTRNYAKRQLTWFRNQGDYTEVRNLEEVMERL